MQARQRQQEEEQEREREREGEEGNCTVMQRGKLKLLGPAQGVQCALPLRNFFKCAQGVPRPSPRTDSH